MPRAAAARVASAAAHDPEIAAQIATLRELKAAIPQIVPERSIRLPATGGLPRGPVTFAIAACIAMILATGLLRRR